MTPEQFVEVVKGGDVARVAAALSDDPQLAASRLSSGETPLMSALYRGHHQIVNALVAAGAPIDVFAASALGRLNELTLALKDRAQADAVSYDGWTPLHLAAFFGQKIAAERLLEAGADIHAVSRNSMRNTPLHAATAGRRVDVALLLIKRGAPTDVLDAGGYTPLRIAEENKLTPVVAAIHQNGRTLEPWDPRAP
jgi:ankyrin repeat protein